MNRNDVPSYLLEGAKPEAVALLSAGKAWTYADISHGASIVADHLAETGGVKGDRAILLADNSFFWVVSYLGIMRAGLVCVPVPPTIGADDLGALILATAPRFGLVEARYLARQLEILCDLKVVTDRPTEDQDAVAFDDLRSDRTSAPRKPVIDRNDLAALMFTSGSTGTPCGVMVSHGNIIANTASIIECLQLTSRDRMLAVLPFHYCFGTSLLHTHLRVGASLVLESRFMFPEVILDRLATAQCTGFAGVPSHFQILLGKSTLTQRRFPTLRYVQQAGGLLAPALIDELRTALPGTDVVVMYGQTEATARLSYLPPQYLDVKRGSIGRGIPGVRLRVLSAAGHDVQSGEVGEITAEGDNITLGYWNAPDESTAHFRDGRLYTGDLATIDDDGFIYIVGREKDFLKCRGERVSCARLETQLLECAEIQEVAVVGMADDVLGEAVKAFVVPRSSTADGVAERVAAFCKLRLPGHLVPRQIVVVTALPKNESGKVLKRQLD